MRKLCWITFIVVFTSSLNCDVPARAETVLTGTAVRLDVGGEYASPQTFYLAGVEKSGVGAGNIHDNTIYGVDNGVTVPIALNYMYCVDISNTINVPHDNYKAQVNTIGYIYNQDTPPNTGAQVSTLNPSNSPGALNPDGTYGVMGLANAGEIGYLMSKYAVAASDYTDATGKEDMELALQAAIWTEVYDLNDGFVNGQVNFDKTLGYFVYKPATTDIEKLYIAMLADVHNSTEDMSRFVDDVLWINPYTTTSRHGNTTYNYRQGQVGYIPHPVPLPGTLTMAFSFFSAVGAVGVSSRSRRKYAGPAA